jgi:ABC-2 type transport system permease protein
MTAILALINKEIKVFLVSPIAYVVTILYLLINSFFFSFVTVNYREADLKGIFVQQNIFFLLFIIPALTMRLFAEEKRSGTLEVLLTKPLSDWQLVLGKYLAVCLMFVLMLAFTLYYPIIIMLFGTPELSVIISGYLGLLLVALLFIAIGIFASSLTQNQILAFVIAFIMIFFFWVIGSVAETEWAAHIPYAKDFFKYLGMQRHFNVFVNGVFDTSHIFYFLSLAFFFLYLTKLKMESRKWD